MRRICAIHCECGNLVSGAFRLFVLREGGADGHDCSGGLGLTGGIVDVGNLFDALMGIHKDLADDSILDKYAEVRRRMWTDVIDPMSRENFRRLHDQDPDKARENDEFFQTLVRSEGDEALAKELALVSHSCYCTLSLGRDTDCRTRDSMCCDTI